MIGFTVGTRLMLQVITVEVIDFISLRDRPEKEAIHKYFKSCCNRLQWLYK